MLYNILAEMARRQISKKEVADSLGISVTMFENKLNNRSGFSVKEIFALQKIFNNPKCTFEYLMLGYGE